MDTEVVQADSYPHVHISHIPCLTFSDTKLYSAHADLKENCLAIANLDDGLDLYSLPSMQLMKSYSHGTTNDKIFKVAFVANGQLVSGGQGGCARVYDVLSGQLLEMLEHSDGEPSFLFRTHWSYVIFPSFYARWQNSAGCDGEMPCPICIAIIDTITPES